MYRYQSKVEVFGNSLTSCLMSGRPTTTMGDPKWMEGCAIMANGRGHRLSAPGATLKWTDVSSNRYCLAASFAGHGVERSRRVLDLTMLSILRRPRGKGER